MAKMPSMEGWLFCLPEVENIPIDDRDTLHGKTETERSEMPLRPVPFVTIDKEISGSRLGQLGDVSEKAGAEIPFGPVRKQCSDTPVRMPLKNSGCCGKIGTR